jgi:cytochrome c oxidase cbb3-type subunit 3
MPAYSNVLNDTQLTQVSSYVLSLSGEEADAAAVAEGQKIFQGETGGCYMCHTSEGKGMYAQGAANLTDKIWTVANLPAAETAQAKLDAVKAVIHNGVKRQMPVFGKDGRNLSDTEIKVLTAYLQQMSSETAQ